MSIVVNITQDMLDRAKERYEKHPESKRTVFKENLYNGFVGEEVFQKAFPDALSTKDLRTKDLYNYDFMLGMKRIEIKTKTSKIEPIPSYFDCSVLDYLKEFQKPDYYVFIRNIEVNGTLVRSHIIGIISTEEFYKKCKVVNKGDILPNTGYPAKTKSFNTTVADLVRFESRSVK
jgi:hypothetical protein